jgi:hypothetical protein
LLLVGGRIFDVVGVVVVFQNKLLICIFILLSTRCGVNKKQKMNGEKEGF